MVSTHLWLIKSNLCLVEFCLYSRRILQQRLNPSFLALSLNQRRRNLISLHPSTPYFHSIYQGLPKSKRLQLITSTIWAALSPLPKTTLMQWKTRSRNQFQWIKAQPKIQNTTFNQILWRRHQGACSHQASCLGKKLSQLLANLQLETWSRPSTTPTTLSVLWRL